MTAYAPLTDEDRADVDDFLNGGSFMARCIEEAQNDLDAAITRLVEIGIPKEQMRDWLDETLFQNEAFTDPSAGVTGRQ
jgi:hypothetical protein